MDISYDLEELKLLLISHLNEKGYVIEEDKILDENVNWRPPIYASKDSNELIIDIRLNNTITDFWLDIYKLAYLKIKSAEIFIAIPENIVVPYSLGKKLEAINVGIILISDDEITFLLEPRSTDERETTKAIRKTLDAKIDKTTYEDLEPYATEITDSVNIFEIGCPREAIGAIGRVLEAAIDDFLEEANNKHKIAISRQRRNGMNFDSKIHFLRSDKNRTRKKPRNVTASEESKMLSVKWDRNIGDHPSTDEEIKQLIKDSRAILELGINMVRLMKTKREQL